MAERRSNTETTDIDSNADKSTPEEFTEPSFENGVNSLFMGHSFFIGQDWMARGASMEDQQYADLNEQGAQRNFEIAKELRAIYPNNQIYSINYGKIAAEMKFAFSAGQLPDIEKLVGKDDTSLFIDDKIGHGGRLMHEFCALTWVNILYDAEIDEVAHTDFSEEALQILIESIEYNSQFK